MKNLSYGDNLTYYADMWLARNEKHSKRKKSKIGKICGTRVELLKLPFERRLGFLKRMAGFGGTMRKDQTGGIRDEFDLMKNKIMPYRSDLMCECCGQMSAEHRHHIRSVSCGGTNSLTNLIWVCENCHRKIHPTFFN